MTTRETCERLYADCHIGIGKHVGAIMRRYPDEVDDVLQHTWEKVLIALPKTEREPGYRWVQKIATNTALDVLRTRALHRRLAPTVSLDAPVPGGSETGRTWEEMLASETCVSESVIARERLDAVLSRLSASYRRLVLLSYQGYSHQEIADRQEAVGANLVTLCSIKNSLPRAHMKARAARDEEARSG